MRLAYKLEGAGFSGMVSVWTGGARGATVWLLTLLSVWGAVSARVCCAGAGVHSLTVAQALCSEL